MAIRFGKSDYCGQAWPLLLAGPGLLVGPRAALALLRSVRPDQFLYHRFGASALCHQ